MSTQFHESQRSLTEIEIKVARVWMEVLKIDHDIPKITLSFLDLGGDSVSAALCVSRLRSVFGPDLDTDLSDFFDPKSTIEAFAKGIEQSNSTEIFQ
jgi:acyl carrier protein